ncbi:MAG: tripartite tricarboxylate transporter substrate binding protein [Alphaproteobacteria bacterium]|nr:tripartite tricarboxylate transporter substrate binding protein [Alphaproteobacteria bacterium]
MRKLARALALLALLPTAAAAYPERPVKLIVPWAAGGDTDNIFRPFGQAFQKQLGETVVIANIGGASGTVGAREAKNAPADGYTLFAVHDYIHLTYYTGVSDVAHTDFAPVCAVASTPSVLTASPKTKWRTLPELVADAKARPGQITVGATLGSTSHFFPAIFEKAAGVRLKYVSYDGLAQRMNAILGGHIDLTDGNLTQKGKVDAGQLRFLAVGTEKRSPEIPDVPTFKELGLDVVYAVVRGVMAPKATPEPVLATLDGACTKAVRDPVFAQSMKVQGTDVHHLDRKGYAAFLARVDAENRLLAQELGLLRR